MVSPIQNYAVNFAETLNKVGAKPETATEKDLSKIYIRAVGEKIYFEVKKTGFFQGVIERFKQLFSPQNKLTELKNALAAINKQLKETELTEETEPFIKNLEVIRNHVIDSLNKPALLGLGQKSRLERANSLAAIRFKHFTPKTEVVLEPTAVVAEVHDSELDSTEEESISTPPVHSKEELDELVKTITTATKKLPQADMDLFKLLEGSSPEEQRTQLPQMRQDRVVALELCNAHLNLLATDKAWPDETEVDKLAEILRGNIASLTSQINIIDESMPKDESVTVAPKALELKEHKITRLEALQGVLGSPQVQQLLTTIVSSKSFNPLSLAANIGLTVALPAVANFASRKVAEHLLPENMSDTSKQIASFATTMASALLVVYGVEYASGYMMTRLETTHPQANATTSPEQPVGTSYSPTSNLTNATQVVTPVAPPVAPQQFFETAEVLPFPVTTPVEMQTPPAVFTNVTTPETPVQVPFEQPAPIAKLDLPMSNLTDRPSVDEAPQTRTFPEQTAAVKSAWDSFWEGVFTPNKNIFTK